MADAFLTTKQVAEMFGVHAQTVISWADAGRIECVRTLGQHRRYPAPAVHALLAEQGYRNTA